MTHYVSVKPPTKEQLKKMSAIQEIMEEVRTKTIKKIVQDMEQILENNTSEALGTTDYDGLATAFLDYMGRLSEEK